MKVAPIAEVKTHFSRFVDECRKNPVVVTRNGRATAVLVAVESDEDLEAIVLSHSPRLRRMLDAADRSIQQGEGLGHEEFWAAAEAGNPVRSKPPRRASRPKRK